MCSISIYFSVYNNFLLNYNSTKTQVDFNLIYQLTFFFFLLACLYTTTFLPNGKYYQLLGGNTGMLFSYFYILLYLTFPSFKTLAFFSLFLNKLKLRLVNIM